MRRLLHIALTVALYPAVALASITSSTGDIALVPQGSARYSANSFNQSCAAVGGCPINTWLEQTNYQLTQSLVLDSSLDNSGAYYGDGTGTSQVKITAGGGPTLNAGRNVNSYFLFHDPLQSATRSGTITFSANETVLGVLVFTRSLAASDFLRVPGALYPANPNFNARGLEFGPERLQLSADRRTLFVDLTSGSPGDQVRVLTAEVPEPATAWMLGAALLGLVLFHRRF